MKHFAIYSLATGIVAAIRSAEMPTTPDDGFDQIEYDGSVDPLGWKVVDDALTPVQQVAILAEPYTFNQWVDLFPLAEQVAIVTAAMNDPLAKLIYDRAQSASGSIDPRDPRTVDGLRYLVSKGYVSAETFTKIANETP